ncbi:MAG: hypothetical protein Q7U57_16020 [Methylovulum sp.]|nr:hypothetical protein [Methylovulum sp.]
MILVTKSAKKSGWHKQQLPKTLLNHIRYGQLNADQWVEKTTMILEKKIDEYKLNDNNKA